MAVRVHPPPRQSVGLSSLDLRLQTLEQLLVGRVVAEPTLSAPDQRFAFGHSRVVDIVLPTQGNRYRVLLRIVRVASLYVLDPHGRRDFLGLVNVNDRQPFECPAEGRRNTQEMPVVFCRMISVMACCFGSGLWQVAVGR